MTISSFLVLLESNLQTWSLVIKTLQQTEVFTSRMLSTPMLCLDLCDSCKDILSALSIITFVIRY